MKHPCDELDFIINDARGITAPAIQVVILHNGEPVYSNYTGFVDPESELHPVNPVTQFDLASVTKLFTVTTFLRLVEEGRVILDQPVASVLPEFSGMRPIQAYEDPLRIGEWVQPLENSREEVDAARVTFRNLLSHNSGLPAWRPFFKQPDTASAQHMVLDAPFFYRTGERVVYSDLGLILTGMAIEKLCAQPLDACIAQFATQPLNLQHTRFLPVGAANPDAAHIAPTEWCAWRGRRVCAEVHDENAWRMGGVAGHAGLFSTAADLAAFGQSFLTSELLKPENVAEMTRLQAADGDLRRGIGFTLWAPDPASIRHAFHPSSFGHTGFTGTSLWIDPARRLVVAILTNRVYYGRDAAHITAFRQRLHRTITKIFPLLSDM